MSEYDYCDACDESNCDHKRRRRRRRDCDECDCDVCGEDICDHDRRRRRRDCDECGKDSCDHRRRRRRPGKDALVWVPASNGEVPRYAVCAGHDDRGRVYVGRAHESGHLLPGRLIPSEGCTYVAWTGGPSHRNYEVLTNPEDCCLRWVPVSFGEFHTDAVAGGSQRGETLYIGRRMVNSQMGVGKVHASRGVWIGWKGKELGYKRHEILTCDD